MRLIFSTSQSRMETISSTNLSSSELKYGCDLLLDSGSDTFVAGKHAFITEVIEGVTVSAKSFDDSAPALNDLKIVNAVYAYDHLESGEIILLRENYCIYIGLNKDDSIACPNQMRAYGVHVDERPSSLFPTSEDTQCIIVDDIKMQLQMKGPLKYVPI